MRKMMFWILVPRGFYLSLPRYLFWRWSALGVKNGRWGFSSQTHSFHLSPSPSLKTSVQTLSGILRLPGSASSRTSGVPWRSCPLIILRKRWQTWGGPLEFLSETAAHRSPLSHCPSILVGYWCWPSINPTFRWRITGGWVGLVGYWRKRALILPILFWYL